MRQAFLRDAGAAYGDIVYWSKPADWKLQIATPNASARYVWIQINLREGPLVLDVPAAVGAGLFGSIVDAWQVPLADVGPHGEDAGKGARYLLLPPGFAGEVPPGMIAVRFATINGYVALRAIPTSSSESAVAAALALVAQLSVYLLAEAARPPKQRFVDMSGKLFDGIVRFDDSFFANLARIIDEEAGDAAMLDQLRVMGIERGKAFTPDAARRNLFAAAARTAHASFVKAAPDEGAVYWANRRWRTRGSAVARPTRLGNAMFYLCTYVDRAGQPLAGERHYRLRVPGQLPAQLWAATVYDRRTSAFERDAPCVEVSSSTPELEPSTDGSIDLFFGAEPPPGKDASWIYTAPGKPWFAMFRFFGPTEPLLAKIWQLGDIELVDPRGQVV
jgi:hypothetical protein